ncbi:MAG: tyrosine-type recombinase/integrase [Lachnospiraceae bacterium]|nr:tyrosine-type recombinase/integrase [Lachnospiraceae bacterium]
MLEKENLTKKIMAFCDKLPEFCSPFLLETGTEMANTTRLAYAHELDWFFEYLVNYKPDFCDMNPVDISLEEFKKVNSQDISRYLTIIRDQGRAERTVARKRAALSRFFNYLTANRLLPFNPVTAAVKVKIHQSDEVLHLDMQEQVRFLDAVDSGDGLTKRQLKHHERYRVRDVALITLLLDTGMRVSELHAIDIADLDMDACSVMIVRKGGNMQTIYFSDETRDLIREYLKQREVSNNKLDKKSPLFVTNGEKRLSIRAIEVLVKKYAMSSIPGKGSKISPHKMRSSFAMEFYAEEKDILALQRKLGHKNITATNIYAKATDKKMRETRSVLSEKRKAQRKNGDELPE